jgi:hypothetical protein
VTIADVVGLLKLGAAIDARQRSAQPANVHVITVGRDLPATHAHAQTTEMSRS